MYSPLPTDWGTARPLLERLLQENAGATLKTVGTPRRRPDPPRSLIPQGSSLSALITWNAPQSAADIVGWRIYKDDENNFVHAISDIGTRQYTAVLPANKPTAFYVSSINARNVESIKVQVIATANTDQYVVTGTAGATAGTSAPLPSGYTSEPSGGGRRLALY